MHDRRRSRADTTVVISGRFYRLMSFSNTISRQSLQEAAAIPDGIAEWIIAYAERIQKVDFEGARRLFSDAVFGFGTKAKSYSSLDDWHHDQWVHVWPHTSGFRFDQQSMRVVKSEDGSLCAVACEWDSTGIREGGTIFPRSGRCTIILVQTANSEFGWHGVHCHFSMCPS